jgi:glycosyltransferase involved in cell wall biosynthesis
MQGTKPEIIFTFPIALGGVTSFNFNIINNSKLLNNFYSKVILLKEVNETRPAFTEKFDVDEEIVFEISSTENQYYLQKRFSKLLGNKEGAIITDNGFTMEAARRFNNPKTVFSLLHDDYYVDQQKKLGKIADVAIGHSTVFSNALLHSDTAIWGNKVFYIPYGVKQIQALPPKNNSTLKLVFLGRLEASKNPLLLFKIQQELIKRNIKVDWTIIGQGSQKNDLIEQWKNDEVQFYEPATTADVYAILKKQDLFIFPTKFEGTPVAILEAMACGVVTIVNDLPGGIRDIISEKIGFKIKNNNINDFVLAIEKLENDRNLLKQMQESNFELAHKEFDIVNNADNYISVFMKFNLYADSSKNKPKRFKKLDLPIVPNFVSQILRKLKQ